MHNYPACNELSLVHFTSKRNLISLPSPQITFIAWDRRVPEEQPGGRDEVQESQLGKDSGKYYANAPASFHCGLIKAALN